MLEKLKSASLLEISGFFLMLNLVIFISSVAGCWALGCLFREKRIFGRWEPIRPMELGAALGSVVINAGVSVTGWALWRAGMIEIRPASIASGFIDCAAMILTMDLGMYFFHRLAHVAMIYQLIHGFHHRHETTNPISLFVLHPVEVIGFGSLMIVFLMIYPISLGGLLGYLTLNVLFGTLGHSGVEPFPAGLKFIPFLKFLGTSTFHAEHHEHPACNFGFYTLVWDKLFGTLDPAYEERFSRKR